MMMSKDDENTTKAMVKKKKSREGEYVVYTENTSNCYCSLHAMTEVQQMFSFLPRSISVDRQLTATIISLCIIKDLEILRTNCLKIFDMYVYTYFTVPHFGTPLK